MKRIIAIALFVAGYSVMSMSCMKEYTCACDGYNEIIDANSTAEAENTCDAKGPSCELQ